MRPEDCGPPDMSQPDLQRLDTTNDVVVIWELIAFVDLVKDPLAIHVDLKDATAAFDELDDDSE
jgi:hypothetical protein